MRLLKIALLFSLVFTSKVTAQVRYYGAIDVGSKGVKASLYSFAKEAKGSDTKFLFKKTINTKLVSSMLGARFAPAGIQEVADAVHSLLDQMQLKAKEEKIAEVKYYIVGSSGVAKGENKDEVGAAVKAATGIEMDFIDVRNEAYLALASSVPLSDRSTSIYVDIGSGNTKLGCLVGESGIGGFRSSEIPYGSVSGRNAAAKQNSSGIRIGIEKLIEDEVRPEYVKQSLDTPCLRNRRLIYWTGGAAWATATMMRPERSRNNWVRIRRTDIDMFLSRLASGKWNQEAFVYNFPKGTSRKDQKEIRTQAEIDKNDVMDVFAAEDLLSGVSIMKAVLDSSNPSAEIYFARNGNYIYGYALEKYKEERMAPKTP